MALNFLNNGYFAGKVGIGTDSPQSKLHIETGSGGTYSPNVNHDDVTIEGSGNIGLQLFSPTTSYQYIAFGDPDSVNAGYLRYYHGTNEMVFRTNGSDNMRIDSSGNVGIGTTSPITKLTVETSNESLHDVLAVHNAITGTSALGKGAAIRIGLGNNGNYSTKIATIYEGNNPSYLQPALAFFTMNNSYLIGSETEKMRITSAGNVGIGTTSPNVLGFLETGLNIAAGSSSSTTLQQAGLVISGSSDADDADDFGYLSFTNYQSTLSSNRVAEIRINKAGANVNTSRFNFYTANGTALNESMVLGETGLLKLSQYGAGTLVTDASGNITVSSGGGAGGPYLPLAGGTMTGDLKLNDAVVAKFGTGDDLRIQHTGNQSYIQNYTGDLQIQNRAADKDILFRADDGSGVVTSYLVLDGSTTHAYFSNPGNVGIGTTSPRAKLDITNGSTGQTYSNVSGLLIDVNGTSNSYYGLIVGSSTGNSHLAVTNAGNVGIGTTSPGRLLTLSGSVSPYLSLVSNTTGGEPSVFFGDTADDNEGRIVYSNSQDYMSIWTAAAEKMRITSAGNVGIGTTSPSAKLDIISSGLSTMFRLSNTEANATTKYGAILGRHYTNAEENVTGMLITSSSSATGGTVSIGGGISAANAVNNVLFYTAANNTTLTGTERMRIDGSGNVMIGNTGAGAKLDVRADTGYAFRTENASGNTFRIEASSGNIYTTGDLYIEDNNKIRLGASSDLQIYHDGSNSFINNLTGDLTIENAGDDLILKSADDFIVYVKSQEIAIQADSDGKVGLRYNNVEKFATTSTGVSVTGEGIFTGNVGIGTTSPTTSYSKVLQINASGNGSTLRLTDAGSGSGVGSGLELLQYGTDSYIINRESGPMNFWTSNSQKMTILANGNVGIGDTGPNVKLQVSTSSPTNNVAALIGDGWVGNSSYHKEGGLLLVSGTSQDATQTGAGIAFQTRNTTNTNYWKSSMIMGRDGAIRFTLGGAGTVAGSEDFTILSGGNVGIGTTSPTTSKLEVTKAASGPVVKFDNTSGTGGSGLEVNGGNGTSFALSVGQYNGLERFRVQGNGNVGIGTSSPATQLEIYKVDDDPATLRLSSEIADGDMVAAIISFSNDAGGGGVQGRIENVSTEDDTTVFKFYTDNTSSPSMTLFDSGNMTIAGTLTQNSDVRLKENIKPIESALDKVKQMQGVEFNKINSSTKEIGVVAQEIEKIIPELVLEDKEGIKSVAYGNITAVLIEAIKEQQKQIEELKQQLNK